MRRACLCRSRDDRVRLRSGSCRNRQPAHAQVLLASDPFERAHRALRRNRYRRNRLYVLVFIELATRRVHLAGCTTNPEGACVVQQARNFTSYLDAGEGSFRFLSHDRDAKFCGPFDEVLATEGLQVVRTPIRAPRANAICERWIRTVRTEWRTGCSSPPDATSSTSSGYTFVITTASDLTVRCNFKPQEQGEFERTPLSVDARVRRQNRLGGLLHEYYEAAA
jgi:putative transposase